MQKTFYQAKQGGVVPNKEKYEKNFTKQNNNMKY
jgi:hypothetical protein